MNAYRHVLRTSPGAPLRASAVPHTFHVRSPATSRLLSSRASRVNTTEIRTSPATPISAQEIPLLKSPFTPNTIQARSFHASPRALQQQEKPQTPETEPKAQEESAEKKESKSDEAKEEGEKQEGEPKKEKKEDAPPPPPHGDKTPWQVFMETMQTEFKQSQEWNESTKALAASANQIAESEAIRRARQAQEAVSSTAGKVVKTTATAVGKGAQWTWETPVMKGVRKGANVTGEVLDKATKPIRETEAYKSVKEVIDDGSSSRYGGWAEKEERRKRREKWLKESAGKGPQIFEEDPK